VEALGVSRRQFDLLVRDGHLFPVFRGVFAVGHTALGPRAQTRAAALACPGAVISHRSAAALLGFGKVAPRVVDLIPAEQGGRKIDGIKAHRVPYPARSEWAYFDGVPCTSPARTVVDLAGAYGEKEMRETFERAATEGLLDLAAIDAILATGPRRRGAPCLRRVMDAWRPVADTVRYATVRSLFEAKLLPLVAAARLPLPRINARVRTAERVLEVDLLWPSERFVVEADSRRHHGIEIAFERDRRRDRELMAAHYGVLRVTWREVEEEPEAVFAVVCGELERRGEGRPTSPT
jgi:very-short-patch-repair endonuclease